MFNNFRTDCFCHWRLIAEEYSPTIYYAKGYTTSLPTTIETCVLMEAEQLPLAFAIIAQAQVHDKILKETLNKFPM